MAIWKSTPKKENHKNTPWQGLTQVQEQERVAGFVAAFVTRTGSCPSCGSSNTDTSPSGINCCYDCWYTW